MTASLTGTKRTKDISQDMVSVVPTQRTWCPEITFLSNTKRKRMKSAGLPLVRLAPVVYWRSYLQYGVKRFVQSQVGQQTKGL